ncbi:MAG: 50S ribosomal protein L25/general stress protein Ctc [Rhabdochlamydiaceae bacterium]|nr:50S ribosomal protein L25/general stress protein Ctc [Candidatus Amphrikana amoebophyrae]
MKLTVFERAQISKGQLNKMRHEEKIPAVLYVKDGDNKVITVDKREFEAALRSITKGFLSTTIFDLNIDGKPVKAIVKDVQYHKTTYNIIHLDFQQLYEDTPVNINIPLEFTGVSQCVGIKLGGFLRPVKRNVRVNCLPKNIPKKFSLDVSRLAVKQTKRVSDLEVSSDVNVLVKPDNVLVVIAK